ncbi:MAG: hypothetical protein WA421_11310 [Nitrososphaeraceae archaeon]
MNTRSRGTSSEYVLYDPYFYFSDLSLREKDIRKISILFYKEKSCIRLSGASYKSWAQKEI